MPPLPFSPNDISWSGESESCPSNSHRLTGHASKVARINDKVDRRERIILVPQIWSLQRQPAKLFLSRAAVAEVEEIEGTAKGQKGENAQPDERGGSCRRWRLGRVGVLRSVSVSGLNAYRM